MAVGMGEATVDFGAAGADLVTIAVARASVAAATTHVEAYLYPKQTTTGGPSSLEHSVDEHLVDGPRVIAHSIVDGVGFSISAISPPPGRSLARGADYLTGKYNVRWVATE
jgi:hypothetical protein